MATSKSEQSSKQKKNHYKMLVGRELKRGYHSMPYHPAFKSIESKDWKHPFSNLQPKLRGSERKVALRQPIDANEIVSYAHNIPILESIKKRLRFGNREERPPRILIEGAAGFGKSALATKFAIDWANNESYLQGYDLVFLIPVMETKVFSEILSLMKRQVSRVDISEEDFKDMIEKNEDKILLIIDGFKGIDLKQRTTVLPLLHGEQHPKMTIIVTALPVFGTLKIQWTLVCHIPGVISKNDKTPEDQISPERQKFLKDQMQGMLFWWLVKFVPPSIRRSRPILTKTVLYKCFFNHKVKQVLLSTQSIPPYSDVDLFNLYKEDQSSLMGRLLDIGKFIQDLLKEGNLTFPEEKLPKRVRDDKRIFQLDIFKPSSQPGTLAPIHVSFFEFLFAYYVWVEIKAPGTNKTLEDQLSDEFIDSFPPIRHCFFYAFLAGLLDREGKQVFDILKKKAFENILKGGNIPLYEFVSAIMHIITENEYSEEVAVFIKPYIEKLNQQGP